VAAERFVRALKLRSGKRARENSFVRGQRLIKVCARKILGVLLEQEIQIRGIVPNCLIHE